MKYTKEQIEDREELDKSKKYRLNDFWDELRVLDKQQFDNLILDEGEVINVISFDNDKYPEDAIYEVYTDTEWKDELEAMFNRYSIDNSILNYLLLRMRGMRRRRKNSIVQVSYFKNQYDNKEKMMLTLYKISITGTYKNGLFKLKLFDSYISDLDE